MRARRVASAVGAFTLGLAAAGAGTFLLFVGDPASRAAAGLLLAAAPFASRRLRSAAASLSPLRNAAALFVAAALFPVARLLLWNANSPAFDLLGLWHRAFSLAFGARFGNADLLPLPGLGVYLAVLVLPTVLVALAVAGIPLVLGYAAAALGAAAVRREPRAAVPLALVAGGLLGVLWPMACDAPHGFLAPGEFVDDPRFCRCVGLEMPDYPPGVADAASRARCVGLEVPD